MELKQNKEWWLKFIAITIFIGSWLFLIGLKIKNPEMNLTTPIFITIALSVFSLIGIFSKNIKKSINNKDDFTQIVKEEEIKQIIEKEAKEKFNNLKKIKPIELIRDRTVGKNIIYAFRVNLNLEEESFIIILNATYPSRKPTIMDINTPMEVVEKEMNNKSSIPNNDPIVEETITENNLTGNVITQKKITPIKTEKTGDAI